MPNLSANEIVTYKHKRNFIQFGGARPNNVVRYAGQDAQYMIIEGVTNPEQGTVTPIWVPDARTAGKYRLVGRKQVPAAIPQATLHLLERHGSIPRQLTRIGCAFNLYELTGNCTDLSDFLQGWTDYVLIYSGGLVSNKSFGTRTSWEGDDQNEDVLTLDLADVYPIGSLAFGENAPVEISREAVDVTFGSIEQCGNCGPQDDGTQKIYAVTKSSGAGSPGLPAELVYSLNGGTSYIDTQAITGIGATSDPSAIAVVGTRLIIVVPTDNAYYWSDLDPITGTPGSFTKVVTGFVAGKTVQNVYVAGPREVYFCGSGGYIYKSTDITAGVTILNAGVTTTSDLLRISGSDEAIVAVGKGSTVIKSVNRGQTWSTTTGSPSLVPTDILALFVLDRNRYWVGTLTGRVVYTLDGGVSWNLIGFDQTGTGAVRDIKFVNDEVGYFSHDTSTPTARLFATWNGGADWTKTSPRILNFPVFDRANRIAVPQVAPGISANNVVLAGLSGDHVDGILLQGIAARF